MRWTLDKVQPYGYTREVTDWPTVRTGRRVKAPLGDRLDMGSAAFGVTLTIPDPFVAEVFSAQPLDFLMLDTEHSPMSLYQLQTQLIALRTAQAAVLVRVAHHEPTSVMQVLDLGADGVVIPQVDTAEACQRAVRSALYPPAGDRGVGPRRAARLGGDRSAYLRDANSRTFVAVMVESVTGVANIDAILQVKGLGGVIIGAADLSASLGHLDGPQHEDVRQAIDQIAARCVAAGVPFGMYAASPEEADGLLRRGARLITIGSDLLFLEQGLGRVVQGLSAVRAAGVR
jgi:2-keto-3-deoxy-L-rhamnonate aldolase RhmA